MTRTPTHVLRCHSARVEMIENMKASGLTAKDISEGVKLNIDNYLGLVDALRQSITSEKAQVAAALKEAAEVAELWDRAPYSSPDQQPHPRHKDVKANILALIPADAQAALDRVVTEAVAKERERCEEIIAYILQDDLHNRLTPRVVDIAYSAFMRAHDANDEDGGPTDWFNDTKPMVMEAIGRIAAAIRGD